MDINGSADFTEHTVTKHLGLFQLFSDNLAGVSGLFNIAGYTEYTNIV